MVAFKHMKKSYSHSNGPKLLSILIHSNVFLSFDSTTVNGGYKSTNTGNGGYKPTNSKNKEPIPDNKNSKQPEKHLHFPTDTNEDDLETGSGDRDIDTDDEDEKDGDEDGDLHQPIVPTEEEESDKGRNGVIPSVIPSNKNIDEDDNGDDEDDRDDLITDVDPKEVEKTDGIPSKLNHFYLTISQCAI